MLISLSKPKCGSRYIDTCPAKNIQSGIMIILIKKLLRATFKIDNFRCCREGQLTQED